jgi:hypothetical protein
MERIRNIKFSLISAYIPLIPENPVSRGWQLTDFEQNGFIRPSAKTPWADGHSLSCGVISYILAIVKDNHFVLMNHHDESSSQIPVILAWIMAGEFPCQHRQWLLHKHP